MRPRWRKQYFVLLALLAAASQAIFLVAPRLPAFVRHLVDPHEAVLFLLSGS